VVLKYYQLIAMFELFKLRMRQKILLMKEFLSKMTIFKLRLQRRLLKRRENRLINRRKYKRIHVYELHRY